MIDSVRREALAKVDELISKIQSLESFSKIQGDKSSSYKTTTNIKQVVKTQTI